MQSQQSPSELLYLVDDDFRHPLTAASAASASGWHALPSQAGRVQPGLHPRRTSSTAPRCGCSRPTRPGPDNDLADLLDHYVQRAIGDPTARVYAFGERWGPEIGVKDKVFGFQPGNGVHDIHMNQGNSARFRGDDGVWQDGGLLIHFPASRWVGIFLAFQSQAWHTDDKTGHAIAGAAPAPRRVEPAADPDRSPRMVNPVGPRPEPETVLLLNASPQRRRPHRLAPRRPHEADLPAPRRAARGRRDAEVRSRATSSSATRAARSRCSTRRA